MKRKILALVLAMSTAFGSPVLAGAESLADRVVALEEENAALEERIAALEAAVGLNSQVMETEVVIETEAETEDAVLMDEQEFLDDIVESYNGRGVVSSKFTTAEINTMTSAESVEYYNECAEAERAFYEKYKNAVFKDLNIQYLCNQYINGLKKQYDAYVSWGETQDFENFYYEAGYVAESSASASAMVSGRISRGCVITSP